MAEKPSVKQILEIYYALRASGVQRLPKPLPRLPQSEPLSGATLFLYDFWSGSDSEVSAPPILRRLLERLPWGQEVALSSAFLAPPKLPVLDSPDESVIARLRETLENGHIRRVVCFGWRAGHLLSIALGRPYEIPPEAFEPVLCDAEGLGSTQILVLPDVRELEAYPEWRARVWDSLLAFAPILRK